MVGRGPSPPCIFCQIARSSSSTVLLHSDGEVVAFQDVNPSAFRHLGERLAHWAMEGPSASGASSVFNNTGCDYAWFLSLGMAGFGCSSSRHYLVIPVEHIPTVKDLKRRSEDYSLVNHMLNVGQNLLLRDAPHSKQYRFGFHQPPFNSVDHLHLHCFALPYVPSWKRLKYLSLGPLGGFIEAEKLLERIRPSSSIPSKI